jgi:septal ring factor EnvC (AmiA/AmiB activator)
MEDQIIPPPDQLGTLVQLFGVWGTVAVGALFALYKVANKWLAQREIEKRDSNIKTNKEDLEVVLQMIADDEDKDLELIAQVNTLRCEVEEIRATRAELVELHATRAEIEELRAELKEARDALNALEELIK